jgi:hypothetical protein
MEALLGQMFLATLVARLVSAFRPVSTGRPPGSGQQASPGQPDGPSPPRLTPRARARQARRSRLRPGY